MNMIDHIYVLNLENRKDRKAYMNTMLNWLNLSHKTTFINAIDGKKLMSEKPIHSDSIYQWNMENFTSDINKYHKVAPFYFRDINHGEIGCSLSHIKIWKKFLQSEHEQVLILEDDIRVARTYQGTDINAIIDKTIKQCLNNKWQYDLLYLGRYPLSNDTPLSEDIYRPGYSWLSHAYILTKSGAKKLLDGGLENLIIPVDEYIPALFGEHLREDIHELYKDKEKLKALSIYPNLFDQDRELFSSDIN
ncbi:glycosyltransferase family 25 protein [Aureibacter tunicatorum]|uniref:Collagen beta-1,O-galactosyltransferase n=1 Tax=Aureibacter tunicatorum TaxID=866807 RepID=A0AAE4BVH3_9BACT|nr:glycosyltransferase family 25 protein [Aureibacter tunicatorum]MDR6241872.1 collagen beta-1,O-galactosyltransferase [Aureibacter tunicatorum]BDD07479.1 hypothetical protein AUTU_49620 [Aureibacter tunicatorum]